MVSSVISRNLILLEGNEIVTTLYSGDSHIYIWMLGDGSIGLVNPDTMVYDLVANFFGSPRDNVTPFTAIASSYSKTVMGLYIEDALIYFVVLRGNQAMIRKLQSDCLFDSKNESFLTTRRNYPLYGHFGGRQYLLRRR